MVKIIEVYVISDKERRYKKDLKDNKITTEPLRSLRKYERIERRS